jgi:hypothetical protein
MYCHQELPYETGQQPLAASASDCIKAKAGVLGKQRVRSRPSAELAYSTGRGASIGLDNVLAMHAFGDLQVTLHFYLL